MVIDECDYPEETPRVDGANGEAKEKTATV